MLHQVSYRNIDKQEKKKLKELVAELVQDLDEKLGSLARKNPSLHGAIQKHGSQQLYRIGLSLHVPGKTLATQEEGDEAENVIRKGFKELERLVARQKSLMKNEHLWKRKQRRRELKTAPLTTADNQELVTRPQSWFATIEPCLNDLYRLARREITYLQASGDLLPSDITPEELVDTVVVLSFEKQNEKPESMEIKPWLYKLALTQLEEEIRKSRDSRETLHLEERVTTHEGATSDDESWLYDFYQPDEVLSLEDLIAYPGDLSPEEITTLTEEQKHAQPALATMPRIWRQALWFLQGEKIDPEQVALILDTPVATLEQISQRAETFLRGRLADKGLVEWVTTEKSLTVLFHVPADQELDTAFRSELSDKFNAG
ncbi:hypothetical protein GF1_03830 [Desulfolithobacter dissulfuricans]|uniref:Uncharacterized protein n=1 Tax=Desulfolithobacter dissulfuricans TaxID=2795293 RepID=A0A915XIV4_9BACT|nr:hypothetical protein GF1_03830 [Desulfolithobacter dissulfuricans]